MQLYVSREFHWSVNNNTLDRAEEIIPDINYIAIFHEIIERIPRNYLAIIGRFSAP